MGLPADLSQRLLIFGEHHAPGVSECALVGLVQQESRDIAQIEPPEAADRGVGLESVTHRALLEIEAQLADDGPVQQDDRLGARRVAAVFHAILGVGHRLGQRNQNRHVFRAAARHHTGDGDAPNRRGAAVRKKNSQHVFGFAVG
jgi:hypothetical protein